ncbi:polysaccharide deacetylase family protein [Actinacidiphila paucisporea]|uniref:Lipoprotein n=1 Tax=Actinacidiphila paucisporea TaxID=310782 RepID=A0A1M7QJM6_9ACTN|nr:hypothetical protein [Actinacidiphila paucisporea]SHN31439.1 hypothetical protein SAMN05216499_13619 [Actinacidiphila paucisporea]
MHSVRKTPTLVAAGAAAAVLALGTTACSSGAAAHRGSDAPGGPAVEVVPQVPRVLRSIGDGSTADTGPQPYQPDFHRLRPGEKPPQFVVFSWNGAVEDSRRLLSSVRGIGERGGAAMTYFLSGTTLLPADHKDLYAPPRHPRGTSDTGLTDRATIADTVHELRLAWAGGSEIGTYFNGHFCGQDGDAADQAASASGAAAGAGGGAGAGVAAGADAGAEDAADSGPGAWTPEEWAGEIRQAQDFTQHWRTATGLSTLDPLPFDYVKGVVGGRPPCRTDPPGLAPAAKAAGFRYTADPSGQPQIWPSRTDGLWHFPLQDIPVPGRDTETLSSDDGFLSIQSGTPDDGTADREQYASWGRQMRDGLIAGFDRAYHGNRAPLVVGSHLESWNGGVYLKAVEDTVKEVCGQQDVRCVSFKQLADWLDMQDPAVLDRLRGLDVGQAPKGGWGTYLRGAPATPTAPAAPAAPGVPASPGVPSEAVRPAGR